MKNFSARLIYIYEMIFEMGAYVIKAYSDHNNNNQWLANAYVLKILFAFSLWLGKKQQLNAAYDISAIHMW